jgi:hypothetical protein
MRKFAVGLAIALTASQPLPLQAIEAIAVDSAPPPAPRILHPSQRQTLERVAAMVPHIPEPDARVITLLWLSGFYHRFGQTEQSNALWQEALATVQTLADDLPKATLLAQALNWKLAVGQKAEADQLLPEFIRLVQSLPEPTEHSQPLYTIPLTIPEPNRPLNSVIAAYAQAEDIDTALRLTEAVHEPSALMNLVQGELYTILVEQKRFDDAIALVERISTFRDPNTRELIANPTADQILQTRIGELLQFGANISHRSPNRVAPPESEKIYHVAQQWIEQIGDPTLRFEQWIRLLRDREYNQRFSEAATAKLRQLLEILPTETAIPPEERARLLTDLISELRRQNHGDPLIQQSSATLDQLITSLPETEAGLVLKAKLWRDRYCGCGIDSETARRSLQTLLDAEAWNTSPTGRKQKAEFLITLASFRNNQPSDSRRFIQQATEIANALPIGDRAELVLKIAQSAPLKNDPDAALTILTPLIEQAQAIAAADRQQQSQNLSLLALLLVKLQRSDLAANLVDLIADPSFRFDAWAAVANAQIASNPESVKLTLQAAIAASQEVNDEIIAQKLTHIIAIYIRATSPEAGMQILVTIPDPVLRVRVSGGLSTYQANYLLPANPNDTVSLFITYWRLLIPQLPTVEERDREWARFAFYALLMRQPDLAMESIEQIQSIAQKAELLLLAFSYELI